MPSDEVLRAVALLKAGRLVGLPTETVYGLAADASNELAVRSIFAAKGRPSSHPLIVHVASPAAAMPWVREVPHTALALMQAFWPGPLTLVLKRSPLASDAVTGAQDTVAVRVPAHPLALEVLQAFGGGLAAPSANRFGRVSPTTAAHVRSGLGNDVDLVLDGGPCDVGVESTIVDLSTQTARLLRPGGLPRELVESVLGVALAAPDAQVRAPGMLASHYAPRAGLSLTTRDNLADAVAQRLLWGAQVAVLAAGRPALPAGATLFPMAEDPALAARELYATLREIDARGFDVVIAVLPESEGLGLAVRDRLTRAAAPRSE